MSCSGCGKPPCSCAIEAAAGVTITGSGTPSDPWVVSVGVSYPRLVKAAATIQETDTAIIADATGTSAPTGLTVTPHSSGGTFAARGGSGSSLGYAWQVTAVSPAGESVAYFSNSDTALPVNGSATLVWNPVPGATSYRIYRADTYDQNAPNHGNFFRVATVAAPTTTYLDTNAAASGTVPPAANGGAFTLILPDAVAYQGILDISAPGKTPNLVSIQPAGSQTIEGSSADVRLGIGPGANYQAISLASVGTNDWKIA